MRLGQSPHGDRARGSCFLRPSDHCGEPGDPLHVGTVAQAGAEAREMLVEAAAQRWGVDKSQCRAQNGYVVNMATNAKLSYGSLAEAAAKLPVPANVALKDPKDF